MKRANRSGISARRFLKRTTSLRRSAGLQRRRSAISRSGSRHWSAGPTRSGPPKVDNQLLRIGQEAITNAVRHAQARRIHLELTFGPEMVVLRVEDDGRGFDGSDRGPMTPVTTA